MYGVVLGMLLIAIGATLMSYATFKLSAMINGYEEIEKDVEQEQK